MSDRRPTGLQRRERARLIEHVKLLQDAAKRQQKLEPKKAAHNMASIGQLRKNIDRKKPLHKLHAHFNHLRSALSKYLIAFDGDTLQTDWEKRYLSKFEAINAKMEDEMKHGHRLIEKFIQLKEKRPSTQSVAVQTSKAAYRIGVKRARDEELEDGELTDDENDD